MTIYCGRPRNENTDRQSQDSHAFERELGEVDWDSPSVKGIIVNFVCRNILWGTWVTHHFYAIVKGPDAPERAKGADAPAGAGGGSVSASERRGAPSIEDGSGSSGVGREPEGDEGDEEGEGSGCFKRLSPIKRRVKQEGKSRVGCGEGVPDSGDNEEEGAEMAATEGGWYSLDSRLPKPQRLGGTRGLLAHLAWEVREHHGHVFVVDKGLEAADGCGDDLGQELGVVSYA